MRGGGSILGSVIERPSFKFAAPEATVSIPCADPEGAHTGVARVALQPAGAAKPLTDAERLERVASLACDLLTAIQPWELLPAEVRSAAVRLTVALAAIPLPRESA